MKNKLLILVLSLALALTLCACSTTPETTTPETTPQSTVPGSTVPVSTVPGSTAPDTNTEKVTFSDASGELLSDPNNYEYFEKDAEIGNYFAFTASEAVSDFKVFSISFDEITQDGKSLFTKGAELFTLSELTAEKPLVIKLYGPGPFPNVAISYNDADGNGYVYAICESGEDGSLYLKKMGESENFVLVTVIG